jgi:acetyl esterase/lipase
MKAFPDTPCWNAKANKRMWELYWQTAMPDCAHTLLAGSETLAGLPDAYVETAEFDCLRDEGAALASALEAAGSRVEYHLIKGAIHGFEIAYKSKLTRESMELRIQALKRAFGAQSAS